MPVSQKTVVRDQLDRRMVPAPVAKDGKLMPLDMTGLGTGLKTIANN